MSTFLTILAAFAVAALLVGVIVGFALLKSDHNRVPNPKSQGEAGDIEYAGDVGFDCGGSD
ncbi:hypothetical protein [Erythrobacter oryzae]|uniref:hypothetical protein n=1 Tax=Erythrobacter oryzae TaxID=3019556 RepID=UPI00255358BF|nr:hypothetical protein [Erythrobacter sp. COR-2]